MALVELVVACIALWILLQLRKAFGWWRARRHLFSIVPEGSGSHWLYGHVPVQDMTKERSYFLNLAWENPRKYIRHYGPALSSVVLSHPETVADAMRQGPGKFHFIYDFYKPILGNGLVTSSGKRWARDHKLLLKAFTQKMLSTYVVVYKSASSTFVSLLEKHVGNTVNISPMVGLLSFDIILQCVSGAVTNCQTETDKSSSVMLYNKAVANLLQLTMDRFTQPWLYNDWIYSFSAQGKKFFKYLAQSHAYTYSLIRARREELKDLLGDEGRMDLDKGRDMLDTLIGVRDDDGVGLSDEEVREHMDTLLFAGRDTTSNTVQFAILHLADNPDCQEKCRDEIRRVVNNCGGLDAFGHEHLSQLNYLFQFMQESLRCSSVISNVAKTSPRSVEIDGVKIPPKVFLSISIFGVHHNPEFWDNPEKFDPDRFSPEKSVRHPYSFIPFSTGTRSCLGRHFALNEVKVILTMLLLRYRLVADPTVPKPHWRDYAVARPEPGVRVRLEAV